MCGIAGAVGVTTVDRLALVRRMRERLVHRGPDSGGEHAGSGAVLGVRRLRVIDLVTGDQPISNEDGTVWTILNGEIYNFAELRRSLEDRGHRFGTKSDTEVIVHLYEDHGPQAVAQLDGMFALAIWDEVNSRLTLARDRFGKKPLLYLERDGELLFASEHAALLEADVPRRADPYAIQLYLRLGYVPAPLDAIAGIRKLLPAHVLVWERGRTRIERYWQLPEIGSAATPVDEATAIDEVRRLVERSVARRLVADVPIGALLSGGTDSSVVVAAMARSAARVRTFTVAFDEADFSEVKHARRIAERFATEHHETIVRPDATTILPLLVRHYGEPFADSSAVPTYYVCKLAREQVTVALAGDGGDEIFAGYDRYVAGRAAAALDWVPAAVRRAAAAAAGGSSLGASDRRSLAGRARRFLRRSGDPPADRYFGWTNVFDDGELARLVSPDAASATHRWLRERWPDRLDVVAAAQTFDANVYLPDDLLVKVDIASMASSLEVRAPLLDSCLAEFVAALPSDMKLRGTDRKHLLRRAFADLVPAENLDRRKQGFGVPIARWLRGELRDVVTSSLGTGEIGGWVRPDRVREILALHLSGREDRADQLWGLLFLQLWRTEFGITG